MYHYEEHQSKFKYMKRPDPKYSIVAIVVLAVGATTYVTVQRYFRSAPPPASASITAQERYWTDRIKTEGGAAAYADFGRFVGGMSPEIQHQEAHVFGGALYEAEGSSGLGACDMQYSSGCFHEFLGRAIANLGIASIAELNQGCEAAASTNILSCRHGIGHGILAYLGYSHADLIKALATCKNVSTDDPIGGCDAGVFMEYNLQIMLGTGGKIRPVEKSDMQFPCPTVPAEAKTSCYFSQPQWWYQVFITQGVSDPRDIFDRIGGLCMQTPQKYQRPCFEGLGVIAPAEVGFSASKALSLCESATQDLEDELYCKSFAANAIGARDKRAALTVCSDLIGDSYAYCASYAANKSNSAVPMETLPLP